VQQRVAVMIGFKRFMSVVITITGIKLVHRIRKRQFALARLGVQGQAVPIIWNALLIHTPFSRPHGRRVSSIETEIYQDS
jgi:hypothetical protein